LGKDLPTKNFLNCPDVFADISNVNLFDGEDLLSVPEDWKEKLEPLITDHPVRIIHLATQDEETRTK
jgi:hypothetical protein